jgi:hypothetical protein
VRSSANSIARDYAAAAGSVSQVRRLHAVPGLKLHEGDRFPVDRLPPLERETLVFFYPAALTGG